MCVKFLSIISHNKFLSVSFIINNDLRTVFRKHSEIFITLNPIMMERGEKRSFIWRNSHTALPLHLKSIMQAFLLMLHDVFNDKIIIIFKGSI